MSESDNLNEVLASLDKYGVNVDKAIAQLANDIGMRLTQMVMHKISRYRPFTVAGETSGATYTWKTQPRGSKKSDRRYTKATSGEPPMVRTGNLRRSVRPTMNKVGPKHYEVFIGAYTKYARRLELGGGNWPADTKFPYLEPTVKEFRKTGFIKNKLRSIIQKGR